MPINQKAQSWSVDVILGSIVFIAAFFAFYALLNAGTAPTVNDLKSDASIVVKEVASQDTPFRIVDNNEVNISRLVDLKNYTYSDLKRKMRIGSDFCIYFENENGDVILINNTYKGIGSPNINLSGTPCSQ